MRLCHGIYYCILLAWHIEQTATAPVENSADLGAPSPSPIQPGFEVDLVSRGAAIRTGSRNFWMSSHLAMNQLANTPYESLQASEKFEQYSESSVGISTRVDGYKHSPFQVKHAMWSVSFWVSIHVFGWF